MVRIIVTLIGLYALLLTKTGFAFVNVTATVDKNPVVVSESFVLTVTADDDINTNALDTSPLMQDFIVGRTSVSTQTSMINFKTTRTTKWSTVLIAREAGTKTIPALTVDSAVTQPITLNVLAASDPQASKQQDLFITTDISAKEVYVQQQLTLTVKLHFAAELKRGSLTEPSLTGANITQIGKDKEADTIINGRRYRVIERTYAISPQQSGEFTLKSPIFSGEIMQPSTRRNGFLSFAETKPVSVIGEEIPLTIRPIPADYQGAWLPSELLSIHQEWQPSPDSFIVGEPITRIITLTAAGLSEEQLPDIEMAMPEGLKVYPDQAELHTGLNNERLVSQKVKNFAIVANKAGVYQLPEIIIPWWNTVTNQYQQAVIPAQTITVAANPEQTAQAPISLASEMPDLNTQPSTATKTVTVYQSSWLQWLFLALWLLTSFAWFITYIRRNKLSSSKQKTSNVNDSYLALLAACKQHNGEQALALLVPWYNSMVNQKISTIADVIHHTQHETLISAINDLQQCTYSKDTQPWLGDDLMKAITEVNKQPNISASPTFAINP
ncbi:BatD family protein [Colwellia sp. 1_MG-2023]|uniref:BatD family protein n=1 Tax=Colwellia sp. 1_MG-2023 TaxID=3062649 RepID=UPI0026E1D47B|nr:BatD family protein [Colwellia sp. 1_MG-2023]MDO6444290.1 BatD family protein [Colwellia sp. 1_MG-2023]